MKASITPINELDFSIPKIMGILNVTPDAFFSGGRFQKIDQAILHALKLAKDGATWIDIGGESSRPGAEIISEQEELDRVLPIIQAVKKEVDIDISVDTAKAKVMQAAINSGATLINDVYALRRKDALKVVADAKVNVCLMHMSGEPKTFQQNYKYDDVTKEIFSWLATRVSNACQAGVEKSRIIVDPGFGFGKSDAHNLTLLARIKEFCKLGVPVMLGMSRKYTIGRLLNREVSERLPGSLALAIVAMLEGVHILRVHDVRETLDVIKMLHAVKTIKQNQKEYVL